MIASTLRNLRRSPGFVAIAAISLGTALGLSTAVFGLIDAMQHPHSAIKNVDDVFIVQLYRRPKAGPSQQEMEQSVRKIPYLADMAGYRSTQLDVQLSGQIQQLSVAFFRENFWTITGVHARIGRLPAPSEARGSNIAVVSDRIWRAHFSNLSMLGPAKIILLGQEYAVVGVLPRDMPESLGQIFIPDVLPDAEGKWLVRLQTGDHLPAVHQYFKSEQERLGALFGQPGEKAPVFVRQSLKSDPLQLNDYHRALVGSAFAVLLIACANVAALMLARGMVRRRDYALQLALGAPRSLIFRAVAVEVAGLTIIGCVVGAFVAAWAISLMTGATPDEMRWLGFVAPQWSVRVLLQGAAAILLSTAIAGGYPAWRASRIDPAAQLKESSGGNTGRISTRFRLLVVAELTLAMTLLVSTSLMVKSVGMMEKFDFEYNARGLLAAGYWMPWRDSTTEARKSEINRAALAAVRVLPSVRSAAMLKACTISHQMVSSDRTAEGGTAIWFPGCANVSAEYFATLGIQLRRGRDFSESDADGAGAAIIDEKTAKKLFPHDDPLGRLIKLGQAQEPLPWIPVVGVVANKREFTAFPELGPDSGMVVYVSMKPTKVALGQVVFRPAGEPGIAAYQVRRALTPMLPPTSSVRVENWTKGYDTQLKEEYFLALMFKMLGVASLFLAAAGLFSVVSYIANQRNREFAVRIALGAPTASVLRLVMREALTMSLGGTALGAGVGMYCGFMLWDKMWGVYPVDSGALVVAESVLIAVTLLSCLAPAIRATKADPLDIIRAS